MENPFMEPTINYTKIIREQVIDLRPGESKFIYTYGGSRGKVSGSLSNILRYGYMTKKDKTRTDGVWVLRK